MADTLSKERRSALMKRVKQKHTAPELTARKELHKRGLRYNFGDRRLPGSPDMSFPRHRAALFVHGCFWHGHDCVRGARVPKDNRDYWVGKVERNRARDERSREALTSLGWRVETIWECHLKDAAALEARLRSLLD